MGKSAIQSSFKTFIAYTAMALLSLFALAGCVSEPDVPLGGSDVPLGGSNAPLSGVSGGAPNGGSDGAPGGGTVSESSAQLAAGASAAPAAQTALSASAAKNEVVIGFPDIPSHFDPLQGFNSRNGALLIFSALVETDAGMNVVPGLAESHEISDDALTHTFNLRSGARFSDGAPVLASDVVFTYESLMKAATSTDLSPVESVTADSEADKEGNTVIIKLKEPRSTFILTVAEIGIVPEHAYAADFGLNPIGSGPYKLAQYDPGQQFILEANDGYYGVAPAIRRAIFVKTGDEDTRFAAASAGQVDVTLTGAVLAAANSIPGYRLLVEESVDNMGFVMPVVPDEDVVNQYGFAVGNNITSDVSFRKSLAYGLDREAICRDALNGYATPAYTENDGMPWSNPESKIGYDPEYAARLLEDAGWRDADGDGIREKNGVRASFPLLYFAGDSTRQAVAMAAAQQARENLGIEILVGGTATDELSARMFAEPMILAWGSQNPMTSYYLFHSSRAGLDDWYNPENYRSGAVDAYLEQALAARSIEEAAPLFQKAQWDGASGTSMRGDCPYVFLINISHLYWVRDGLDTGDQKIHAHGGAWPLVENLRDWQWVE